MDGYTEGKAVSSNTQAISQPRHGWSAIDWAPVQTDVFKLQKRIYQASKNGEYKRVHSLQRLLLSSRSAKLLAVRRVSQDNRGKKTAGIDGVKNLKPSERLYLADTLELPQKSSPTRRVYIDKPGTGDKRPLGIPTMYDRACQALVKMALEPEWEAKFEPSSYGFRPGRSAHDAIKNILIGLQKGRKWILDADISGCFDNIDHDALLSKLNTYPELRHTIKVWLKAGYLDGNVFNRTEKGTPQGGVISPLLANIALHGMEEHIEVSMMQGVDNPQAWYAKYGPFDRKGNRRISPKVIRYADDFVIIFTGKEVIEESKIEIAKWLAGVGLELKDSKTNIRHSKEGFDFLGFAIRQFDTSLNKIGFKTIVKPSKKSVLRHNWAIKSVLRSLTTAPTDAVISKLNPIIRGWSNYFKPSSARKTFESCDDIMNHQLRRWVDRRHHSGKRGLKRKSYGKYFRTIRGNQWRFVSNNGNFLMMHSEHAIKYHTMVAGNRSPYDGDTIYWAKRLGRSVEISPRMAKLLKLQNGRCKTCQIHFDHESIMEVHHIGGNHKNDTWKNLALLHGHCHDSSHSATCE